MRSRWPLLLCVLASFVVGFGVSFVSRRATLPPEARIQIADFRVAIPEGETVVTITSRDASNEELGRLTIQRYGNTIAGVPEVQRRIEPRKDLTTEDAAYLRRELSSEIPISDSAWQRSNKIRLWLAQRCYRVSMPGLNTREPRKAYDEMKGGQPVLCGNLAEIYVALCQAMGLTARAVGLSVAVQNGLFGIDTHAAAEVWLPEMGGWIYQDPTFNCYWKIDGKPASAMLLHDAVMERRAIEFAPQD